MGFQHIDRVDGVFGHPLAVHELHSQGSIHHHVSKEVSITEGSGLRQIRALVTYIKLQAYKSERFCVLDPNTAFYALHSKEDTLQ